jgi:anhydro-N-acetylmuramic acid kinase
MDSRRVIGVSLDAGAGEIEVLLADVAGIGLDCRVHAIVSHVAPTLRMVGASGGRDRSPESPFTPGSHTDPHAIADRVMDAIKGLIQRAAVPLDQVVLISLTVGDGQATSDEGLIAARLAELSGVTVVMGFAARDRAAGGRGRAVGTLIDWMVASDQRFSRIVVHFDYVTRVTILPAATGPSRVRSFEVGPGIGLLDALAAAFSQGRPPVDSRGMLAVQGRQIKPLVRRWATHPFLRQAPPKALSSLDFAGPFVGETLQLAVERGWSVADVLCTATHFVAACPADAVRQFVLREQSIEQVIVVGRGTQNGFLLRMLEEQFADAGITTIALADIARDTYEAMAAAVLGCLALDGVSANLPGVTGAIGPRLLGQFVPGSIRSWQRCVEWIQRAVKLVATRAA